MCIANVSKANNANDSVSNATVPASLLALSAISLKSACISAIHRYNSLLPYSKLQGLISETGSTIAAAGAIGPLQKVLIAAYPVQAEIDKSKLHPVSKLNFCNGSARSVQLKYGDVIE
jgi:hypothetical protein